MSNAPERIWAWPFNDWYRGGCSTAKVVVAGAKDVEYIRKDLALAKPTVKPLEWTFESQTILRSFGEVFRYEVANTSFPHLVYQLEEQPDFKGWRVKVCVFGSVVYWVSDSYPRPDQAKAAAQADYECRILSALENNT